jgi:endoglucanase Acf2
MGYIYNLTSFRTMFFSKGFNQERLVSLIYRGLMEGKKTEELIRLVLSKPAGFRPFMPEADADRFFSAVLSHYASGCFAESGIQTMREWVELVNNYSASGLIARGMMLKGTNEPESLKLSKIKLQVELLEKDIKACKDEEEKARKEEELKPLKDKIEKAYKTILGLRKSIGNIKIIEDHLYYHADEISAQLGLKHQET